MSDSITKSLVDGLQIGTQKWDSKVKGFGVRRNQEHSTYFVKYRIGSGRNAQQRMLTIGRHGSPWTPDTARRRALEILYEARQGRDPAISVKPAERSATVSEICNLYLEGASTRVLEGKGRPKKPRTIEADRSNVERHVKPLLGRKRIDQLSTIDIQRFQENVAAGKTAFQEKTKPRGLARVRGGKGIAARATAVLASILNWAVKQRIIESNPAKGVTLFKANEIVRYLTEEEAERLGQALYRAEQDWFEWQRACETARSESRPLPPRRGENPIAIRAIEVLLLTGARKLEVLGLRWDWIDLEKGLLLLPDSKTGRKTILLTKRVIEIFSNIEKLDGEPYVFPGAKPGRHFVGLAHVWVRLRKAADISDVRLHDLRHSFATAATTAGYELAVVGRMLGHADLRSTRKYAHVRDNPLRAATEVNVENIARALGMQRSTKS